MCSFYYNESTSISMPNMVNSKDIIRMFLVLNDFKIELPNILNIY